MESTRIPRNTLFLKRSIQCSYAVEPKFVTQPPNDLRKSNFFNFTIELTISNNSVDIQEARFLQFLNEENVAGIRNGVKYLLRLKYANGSIEQKYLYLTLVDAETRKPIVYEGHDDNPKMKRVLLTHEAICTRCSQQKSCGNKNEAPSDPQTQNRGQLKFFLKCNQNCLKGAGNPRDMRRFAIALSFEDITEDQSRIRALSDKIFVHNNSKHNRKRKKDVEMIPASPVNDASQIGYIHPIIGTRNSTFAFYSRDWSREKVSFKCDNFPLPVTSLIPDMGMTVLIPYSVYEGRKVITLCYENSPVFCFPYEIQDCQSVMPKALQGFLCLFSTPIDYDMKPDVGPNNAAVCVLRANQVHDHYSFQNVAYPPALNYGGPHQNFVCSSSTPSPEMHHLSGGNDSSPTYQLY